MSTTYAHIKGEVLANSQVHAKPGKGDEVADWIEKLKAYAAENEPETLEYSFARISPDGDMFVTWERFANIDAIKKHVSNPVMKEFQAAELLEKPPAPLFYFGDFKARKSIL